MLTTKNDKDEDVLVDPNAVLESASGAVLPNDENPKMDDMDSEKVIEESKTKPLKIKTMKAKTIHQPALRELRAAFRFMAFQLQSQEQNAEFKRVFPGLYEDE